MSPVAPGHPQPTRRLVMATSAPGPAVRVAVWAEDALSRTGLAELASVDRRTVVVGHEDRPDVALLGFRVVSAHVMETLNAISTSAGCPVILVCSEAWDGDMLMAVQFGVRAILRRADADRARLLRTLQSVANGGGEFSSTLQGRLLAEIDRVQRDILAPRGLTASGLSDRELDVLRLLAAGHDLGEIADQLRYSERTVKNILYTLLHRLGLRNRVHAVSYAMRAGLI